MSRKRSTEKLARLAGDLVNMLAVISRHERLNVADILDPLVRESVTARYLAVPPDVRAVIESYRAIKAAAAEPAAANTPA